jgi:hypothetical protein
VIRKGEERFILEGVRIKEQPSPRGGFFDKRTGIVTYSVKTTESERRREKRSAVRLQSGKVLGANGRFLVDFLFVNRGSGGARISLAQRHPLPRGIWLYEDLSQMCRRAEVVWQNGRIVGCRFKSAEAPLNERLLSRYRTKYYALE